MKKIIAFIFVSMTLLMLISCSEKDATDWALSCGDTKISKNAYQAQLVTYKSEFLLNYLGVTEDNEKYWTQDSPGGRMETVADTLLDMTLEDMVQFVWVIEYAKKNGFTIGEEERAILEEDLETLRSGFETDEEYLEYIGKLGLEEADVTEYVENTLLYDKGFEKLTSEGGLYEVTDETIKNYYSKNFYTVKQIFLNDVNKLDEEGNAVELTEEEKSEKTLKAEEILKDLESGMPFDLYYIMGEDGAAEAYPNGMTFTKGVTSDVTFEDEVAKMKIGDYKIIRPENGGVYVVARLELDENAFSDYEEYVYTAVYQSITEDIYRDHSREVEVNEEVIGSFDIKTLPVLG